MANYPGTYNFELIKGSTWSVELSILDADDKPVDLTSSEFQSKVCNESGRTIYTFINVDIVDPRNGKISMFMDYTVTERFPTEVLYYDLIRIQDNNENPYGSEGPVATREYILKGMITVQDSFTSTTY